MKPIKERPYRDSDVLFDKELPITKHNFPLTTYTNWKIYGYKKDPLTGIKRPYWLDKRLPTGRPLTPKMCGLDGFYDVRSTNQVI
jgi:hypothetical protein